MWMCLLCDKFWELNLLNWSIDTIALAYSINKNWAYVYYWIKLLFQEAFKLKYAIFYGVAMRFVRIKHFKFQDRCSYYQLLIFNMQRYTYYSVNAVKMSVLYIHSYVYRSSIEAIDIIISNYIWRWCDGNGSCYCSVHIFKTHFSFSFHSSFFFFSLLLYFFYIYILYSTINAHSI